MVEDNSNVPEAALISHAQTILDRVLFIAFAEDQTLLPDNTLEKAFSHRNPYHPGPVWENFKGLFQAIDKGNPELLIPAYNGGLFRHDEALENLVVSDVLCEGFKRLGEYDFNSEVNVTVIGHIFENSITDLENLQSAAEAGTLKADLFPAARLSRSLGRKPTATKGKRKREGVVYTPDSITRFIVEQTLGAHLEQKFNALWQAHAAGRNKSGARKDEWKSVKAEQAFWKKYQNILRQLRVVDPACGSGAFLVAAFNFLYAEYVRVNERLTDLKGGMADLFDLDKEILNQNLYGVDINHESIEISKLSLWLKTAKRGKVLNSLDHNVRVGDSVIEDSNYSYRAFTWREAFPEVFAEGGFDVVLGNPPYVRQELILPLKPYLQKRYEVFHSVGDLYTYFFELGLRLLKPGGRLGYISSNTFFKTGSGKPLRQHLLAKAKLESIVDFGDLQVFEGVTTYPAVLVLEKGEPKPDHQLEFLALKDMPETDIVAEFEVNARLMAQSGLMADSWQLQDGRLAAVRRKIADEKPTLKEVYGSPLYGIKTGLNEAFVIDRATRDRLIDRDLSSNELIRPYLEGKDIKPWHTQPRELFLIYPPKNTDIENYTAIHDHLLTYRERLEPKPTSWPREEKWPGRKAGSYKWYETQDTVLYFNDFGKPKIVYSEFSDKPNFSLDIDGYFTNNKAFILTAANYCLLGILMSKVIWFYLWGICRPMRGGFLQLYTQWMETIPIPPTNAEQKAEIADLAEICQLMAEDRYALHDAFRRRIPDLSDDDGTIKLTNKLKSWWELADFVTLLPEPGPGRC